MIRIRVLRRDGGLEMTAVGHAEQAPRGEDIVCAGVSALLYGFIAYLETLPPIATAEEGGEVPHLVCSEGEGLLRVRTCGLGGADLHGWEVTAAGLRLIESAWPACVALCDCMSDDLSDDLSYDLSHDLSRDLSRDLSHDRAAQ